MENRDGILAAITAAPRDNVLRLAYADWLDEYGTDDVDAAVGEFIRVSCRMNDSRRLLRKAYEWLGGNWQRILPDVSAVTDRVRRCGRGLRIVVNLPDSLPFHGRVVLLCLRFDTGGLVKSITVSSRHAEVRAWVRALIPKRVRRPYPKRKK